MVHLPLLTWTALSSRGKWNSGRKISVGAPSGAAESQVSDRLKVALRRSKPCDFTVPAVAKGLGRTYASAARKPGSLARSAGVFEGSGEMGGVERAFFMLEGETDDCPNDLLLEKVGAAVSTENVESLAGFWPFGFAVGEMGRELSSREKIERSSPFQRSPCSWLFCVQLAELLRTGCCSLLTNGGHIDPQSIAIDPAPFQREMIRIHSSHLACVITGFIGIFIIHVVRNTNFREDTRMVSHVFNPFISYGSQLISKAVSNCRFPYFDCKCR